MLDYKEYIYAIYQERSFSKAARKLYVSQPWLSATVKKVEQELKLPELAKQVGYSEYYLSRKFKKEMGISISTYIKYVRVEHSKMMLVSSGAPISQIADDLHFASSSHYSESFREVTGKTPKQYRIENQKF